MKFDLKREELIRRRLRYLIQTEYKGVADFYECLYGEAANPANIESFNWFLKRGAINWDFMALVCEKTRVGKIPLGRLLDLDINNEDLFSD